MLDEAWNSVVSADGKTICRGLIEDCPKHPLTCGDISDRCRHQCMGTRCLRRCSPRRCRSRLLRTRSSNRHSSSRSSTCSLPDRRVGSAHSSTARHKLLPPDTKSCSGRSNSPHDMSRLHTSFGNNHWNSSRCSRHRTRRCCRSIRWSTPWRTEPRRRCSRIVRPNTSRVSSWRSSPESASHRRTAVERSPPALCLRRCRDPRGIDCTQSGDRSAQPR